MDELRSFAKINLGLEVTGRRADGYHLLKTVFQTVDLYDTIRIEPGTRGKLEIEGNIPGIDWGTGNTLFKAWEKMRNLSGRNEGFDLRVDKRIPAGAGLGGGSSNAGAFLLYLNRYWKLGLDDEKLGRISAEIGADVPFFIHGGSAIGEGIGERLTLLDDLQPRRLILWTPPVSVPTALVFSRFSLTKQRDESKIDIFLRAKDISVLENNLETTTFALFPELREMKERMLKGGCISVQMSGSGSSFFGFAPEEGLNRIISYLPGARIARMIGRKEYKENIMGCSQAVRHRSLEPIFGGSNPPTPESLT